jgi:hypothetical protein
VSAAGLSRRALFWALAAVTLAVYLAMVLWSLPRISAAAGGLAPFDLRPGGYSEAQARAFLALLGEDGARFYLAVQQRLDTAFPALSAATMAIAIVHLGRDLPRAARLAAAAVPVLGAAFDYLENAAVAVMLRAGANGLTAEMAAAASRWTVLKSAFVAAAFVILLLLLVRAALVRLRARREGR